MRKEGGGEWVGEESWIAEEGGMGEAKRSGVWINDQGGGE